MSNPYQSFGSPIAEPIDPPVIQKRPTSIQVFGILNCVFAAFAFLNLLSLLIQTQSAPQDNGDLAKSIFEMMTNDVLYRRVLLIQSVVGFFGAILLLSCGIGLLGDRIWAPRLCFTYGVYALIGNIAGAVTNWLFLISPLLEKAGNAPSQRVVVLALAVSTFIGSFIGLIYPLLMMWFTSRPHVAEYLELKKLARDGSKGHPV